ncbi:pyridoxamine 5'-phosphate oxidase family protein [Halobacterium wangiae]|uniref:pyridoxamine 5'-phosphate oxidase family protein n=1 Tax=Halobacterium wangiae TaxID=2902623 RepID=UPI001E34F0F9|nr:pyridoxamine 5'-phosphate oxidase family protein [Halobacterium wangiae]
MSTDSPVEMDGAERDAFLGNGGTGMISLSTSGDEPPHAIPVSYGYDATERTFYFRLAAGDERARGNLKERPVAFVTYGENDGWQSVVARGYLEDIHEDAIATQTLEGLGRVDIPLVDIFHVPLREVGFEFYRLVPEELTARREVSTAE